MPRKIHNDAELEAAVARLVPVKPPPITGAELAKRWKPGSSLSPKEAGDFARDIKRGRRVFKA